MPFLSDAFAKSLASFAIVVALHVDLHERAHIAASRGTLRRFTWRACSPLPALQSLPLHIQRRMYLAGPLAHIALSAAVLACTCLLTGNFEGLLPFAHGLICGAAFGFGLGAANLTPFLPDGKAARLLARAARKGANPDLFPPPRSTAHEKAWAFLLGALTSLTATAAGYFLLIFALYIPE